MTNKTQLVEDALDDAFSLSGEVPDYVSVEQTPQGNVKITYSEDDPEGFGEQANRYYIGNYLRSTLDDVTVEHDTSGTENKTFVRW